MGDLGFLSELFTRHMLAEFVTLIAAGLVANDFAGKFAWHPKYRKNMKPPWHHAAPITHVDEYAGMHKNDCVRVRWERGIWHVHHFVMDNGQCVFVSLRNAEGEERNVHYKLVRKHHQLVRH